MLKRIRYWLFEFELPLWQWFLAGAAMTAVLIAVAYLLDRWFS